jgi:hypothetical protein
MGYTMDENSGIILTWYIGKRTDEDDWGAYKR